MSAPCIECGGPSIGRDLCVKHYWRHRRAGTLPPTMRERLAEAMLHEPVIYATNTEDGYLRCQCGWPDPIQEGHFTEHFRGGDNPIDGSETVGA